MVVPVAAVVVQQQFERRAERVEIEDVVARNADPVIEVVAQVEALDVGHLVAALHRQVVPVIACGRRMRVIDLQSDALAIVDVVHPAYPECFVGAQVVQFPAGGLCDLVAGMELIYS